MGRRSSGGRSAPRPRPAAARSPAPQPVHRAPPPAPAQASSGGGMLSGIGSTIAQGMAFGTGSAVAHRAVDSVMGPRTIQHEAVEAASASAAPASNNMFSSSCDIHAKAFQDCISGYGSEISKCQFYMDMLTECRKNSSSGIGA
ncbi:hypothetical protein EUTSA_v10005092mg [Eutrema salsugineum]|uniref:CHCH domain-containing protein n=1 Tax=Eutrema salsugineum TaxID=72664 RepID=V4KVP2_EUTSA|nr:uncharacterized protein C6C3.02c [Eutrema salsugineum]ESQ31443.1 hypothetical protein EUTSA_v10005092mg [Eutrema salsugineum]